SCTQGNHDAQLAATLKAASICFGHLADGGCRTERCSDKRLSRGSRPTKDSGEGPSPASVLSLGVCPSIRNSPVSTTRYKSRSDFSDNSLLLSATRMSD